MFWSSDELHVLPRHPLPHQQVGCRRRHHKLKAAEPKPVNVGDRLGPRGAEVEEAQVTHPCVGLALTGTSSAVDNEEVEIKHPKQSPSIASPATRSSRSAM